MSIRTLVRAVILAASTAAHAESYDFTHPGTVRIDGGAGRATTLQVGCSPQSDGGVLSLEFMVTEANTRKDFDYDDFEGPDAVAADKPLAHLVWTPASGASTEITRGNGGWYIPEPAEAFMFSINQLSHHREPPAKLMAAVGPDAGRLTWTITGFDKPTRKLVATFDLDAAAAKKVHDTVVTCLPINSPKNPAG